MRTFLLITLTCLVSLPASTGYIEGIITSIGEKEFVITGIIVSGDPATETVVLRTGDGEEVTVQAKQGKTGYILGTAFGSSFAETIVAGRPAVTFCYRNREYPNFVVAFVGGSRPPESTSTD